jgi:hypothetical protein
VAHCDGTRPDDQNAPTVADCTQPRHLITLFADGHGTFSCGNVWVMALFNRNRSRTITIWFHG